MTHTFLPLTCVGRLCAAAAAVGMLCSSSRAAFVEDVIVESFDSRADTFAFGVEGGAALTLVDQGGGDKALQFTGTRTAVGVGFFAAGFTLGTLEVEPGPGGPNSSPNLSDYQLSFDLTVNAVNGFTPNLEIWLADGPRFAGPPTNNARLYSVGVADGAQTISFTLDQNFVTATPNGFDNPGGSWSPTADDWWIQVNTISFGAPEGAMVDYTIDNIRVGTVPEPSSVAILGMACAAGLSLARRRRRSAE